MRSPGDSVARYTLHSLLGRGGMGEVYEAEDKVLERRVALKLLPADGDAEARLRMLREARAAAAFEHPNVVTVFDAGLTDEGGPAEQAYIAMELVRGSSLRSFVGDATTSLAVKIGWLADVARALAAAEAAGLIHRDIKPDNVMVRRDGRVKVLDFGVAKRSAQPFDASAPTEIPKANEPSLTARGAFVGTPRYASPEQLRGEPLDAPQRSVLLGHDGLRAALRRSSVRPGSRAGAGIEDPEFAHPGPGEQGPGAPGRGRSSGHARAQQSPRRALQLALQGRASARAAR